MESISKVIAGIPRDLIGNGRNDVEHRQERLESTGFIGYLSKCLVETVEHHQCRRAMRNIGCSGRFEAEESVRWWWLCRGMQPALKAWRPLGTAGLGPACACACACPSGHSLPPLPPAVSQS